MSSDDLHAMSGPALLDRTRDLVAERNRIDAALARTVRVADSKRAFAGDGQATAASWLRGHCRLSTSAASLVVRTGRALDQLPAVEASHAAGALTAEQVDVIAQITSPTYARLIAARGGTVDGVGQVLTRFATHRPHQDLTRLVRQLLERLDQDGPEPDPTDERFLTFARHADGSITGRFHLDPPRRAEGPGRPGGPPAGRPARRRPAHHRPAAGRRARAVGRQHPGRRQRPAAAHRQAAGRGQDRLRRPGRPGHRQRRRRPRLRRDRLRRPGPAGRLRRRTAPLPHRPRRRTARPGASAPLQGPAPSLRGVGGSGVLTFTGCGAPTHWCDVHHVVHWLFGGKTSLANSALLCERHHTKVHHGFRVERDTAGRWHTYRPDGTEIHTVRPENVRPGTPDDSVLSRAG